MASRERDFPSDDTTGDKISERLEVRAPTRLDEVRGEVARQLNVAFVFAHPDDEVLILGLIMRLLGFGHGLNFTWMTNGDSVTPREVKKSETRTTMDQLGIDKRSGFSDESFIADRNILDLVDVIFRNPSKEIRRRLLLDVTERIQERTKDADTICVVAREGGHLIHDLTNWLVRIVATVDKKSILEFPQYSLKIRGEIFKALPDFLHSVITLHPDASMFMNVGKFRERSEDQNTILNEKNDPISDGSLILSDGEFKSKMRIIDQNYPSQKKVFDRFKGTLSATGGADSLRKESLRVPPQQGHVMDLPSLISTIRALFGNKVSPRVFHRIIEEDTPHLCRELEKNALPGPRQRKTA